VKNNDIPDAIEQHKIIRGLKFFIFDIF